ncbi:T9SS type A sorting domain-containing protein [Carboxylicivirga sp. A043]|uniref:choice-of-anchor Q domain-containing protein n=1 Tax=Carboxylicivirga litoralis TaxID=2816963 RepID=UPI0021CAFCB2|nr:choice-of-anchor Q domain-containing protein [Carboxylicivirga sp. A043]MCU4154617.1 T9SS type A sorting domain-containing protein [Carboxylicivirga sp. A043]
MRSIIVLILLCTITSNAMSTIRYVKPNDVSNAWQSQSTVYSDLQLALADAISGDEIWVAEGIYKPTTSDDRTISFELQPGVKLYGGFIGTETSLEERNWHEYQTILSGDIGMPLDQSDNTYTVVKAIGSEYNVINKSTIFDGFIVQHGNNQIYGWEAGSGGGMRCENASPFVINVVFDNNKARNDGGGVYCKDGSNPVFVHCIFTSNTAYMGSGAYVQREGSFYNCLWYNNVMDKSEADYGTSAEGFGVDLYSYNSGNAVVANSIFVETLNNTGARRATYGLIERSNVKSTDPGFISLMDGDFRLRYNAIAIDAGDNSYMQGVDTDYFGNARLVNDIIDAGPSEGGTITPATVSPANFETIASNGGTGVVNFTGEWPATPNYSIVRYFIQYWNNPANITSVDVGSDLAYSTSFTVGQNVSWRYGVELDDGTINYSQVSYFSLPTGTPYFVKVGATGDGSSWANAFGDIHQALNVAVDGDEIWVAEGTYLPSSTGDREVSFNVATGVKLYGGFKGNEASLDERNALVNKTILSGNIGDVAKKQDNSKHVMVINARGSIILDGFIIQDGFAGDWRGDGSMGAGLMVNNGSQIISNVLFKNNEADEDGGAIVLNNSETVIANCIFKNNSADDGGAISMLSGNSAIINSVFDSNSAYQTSAVDNVNSVSNSIFTNNVSQYNYYECSSSKTNYNRFDRDYGYENISDKIIFVDADNDDYRLNSASAGINSACNDSLPGWLVKDFAGKERIQDNIVDMGAFEGAVICPVANTPANGTVFKTSEANYPLDLTGGWMTEADYTISKYIIEYWEKDGAVTRAEVSTDFTINLSLAAAKEYTWRSGVIAESGDVNYSEISTFSIAQDTPYFVKEGGSGDGSSWANAFGTINEALALAVNGDEIWIAAGTYYTTTDDLNREASFDVTTGVKLIGGFAGDEESIDQRNWRLNKTVLSGEIGDKLDDSDNTNRIIYYSNEHGNVATFDGLIIRDAYSYSEGGGMHINKGTANVLNCIFDNNRAYDGAAIENKGGQLNCYNTIFSKNKAEWTYVVDGYRAQNHLSNCVFVNNEANIMITGNGLFTNNIIWGNTNMESGVSAIDVTNSCIQGGSVSNGNINSDPLFINADEGDYRLHYLSPCIDAGDKTKLPATLKQDFGGNNRIINDEVDMGVLEGGIVTPLVKEPYNNEVIEIDAASSYVLLSWEWEEGVTKPDVESYSIDYWLNDGEMKTTYTPNEFTNITVNAGSIVRWRIVTHVVGGDVINGLIQSFNVPHNHPIYVKEGATGDGTSWGSAFGDLQEAMQSAVGGDEFWIAAGTYKPAESDRLKVFALQNGFKLYGGFNGTETLLTERNWNTNSTILSGEINDLTSQEDNSTHVVECEMLASDSAWIDGVIIQDGNSNYWNSGHQYGGGVYATGGTLLLNNTWIQENKSDNRGSALYNNGADIIITNSIISNNTAPDNNGTTVHHETGTTKLINSVVYNNTSNNAGGIYSDNDTKGLEAVNSIICNNTGNTSNNVYGAKVTYSLLEESYYGDGNIVGNPLFVDAENGDYRLQVLSPGINAGINDSIPDAITTDFAGGERILEEVVDMGCFEGGVITPIATSPVSHEIIKGVFLGTDVTFEWGMPEGVTDPGFESYRLEYWTDSNDKTIVADLTEMSYTASLSNGNEYQWQVIAIMNGEEIPSQVMSFSLTHYYAIKVKEGSSGYGDRWDYAFGNLQDAINEAVPGDEIWIAAGTYYPSKADDRTESFEINKQLKIYGGFKGSEVYLTDRKLNPELTLLSGDIGLPNVTTDNAHRIIEVALQETDTLIIDGLTICNGVAEGSHNYGQVAGLNSKGGYVELNNLIVRDNTSESVGAGVFTRSTMRINNSLLTRNISNNNSGAVGAYECDVYVNNSTIVDNKAAYDGGGLNSNSRGVFYVSNSIIWNNGERNVSGYYESEYVYSCIEGMNNGDAVINEDPLFVDAENGNYRLQPNSPAINAGFNDSIPDGVRYDLDGIGRVSWGVVDMGAYEASYPKTVRPADKSPESPSGVLGYTWTLGADIDGVTPDPNAMDATEYKMSFKSWDVDDETKVYEKVDNLGYWGMLSFNFDYRQGYQWKVGVQTEAYTYWSDIATFYIGSEQPLYVKAGSTGNGSSWDNAFGTINEAVDAAVKGDEIWVANGTYKVTSGTSRSETLHLTSYIGLYGGFAGTETQRYERFSNKDHTIISGDIGTQDDDSDNSENLITITGNSQEPVEGVVIDGFTLTKANADANNGGAINANYASYQVLNSYLSDNKSGNGAAIYNANSEVYVYNSQIDNNTSTDAVVYGDVNSKLEMVNATVTANTSGIKSPGDVLNTILYGNTGTQLSDAEASYSCIENGYAGTNIVEGNPDFMDAANKDYRLGKFSSCYNQGTDTYLPGFAYMDLYKNESRSFYGQVDIGASEVGPYQLGKIEAVSFTPGHDAVDVEYDAPISISFNQAIKVVDYDAVVMTPEKVFYETELVDQGIKLNLNHNNPMAFDETYTIEIPAEAIEFAYNSKIPTTDVKFSFTIRSCKPAVIKPEASQLDLCLFDAVDLPVTFDGDYLAGYKWMREGTVYSDDLYSPNLNVERFSEKYAGVYTMVVNDMCGNSITKDVTLDLKLSNQILLKDKWDDVVFVDNSEQQFSDFKWYIGDNVEDTKQYFDLANISGDVFVTALDAKSGCTVYSDTLTVEGGGLKAMSVHPNPVQRSQQLVIKLPQQQDKTVVRLYDIAGHLVSQNEYTNTRLIDYDDTNVKPGVYVLEVQAEGLVEKRKIIIQK